MNSVLWKSMYQGVGKACLKPNYVKNLWSHKNLLGEKTVLLYTLLFPFEKHMHHRIVAQNEKWSKSKS